MMRVLVAFVLCAFCALSVNAATIHVPVDQPTIQAGIDASVNGDTVLVAAGTYVENIDLKGKAIKIIGDNGASTTTLRPADSQVSTIKVNSEEGAGVELQGFTISGGGDVHTLVIDGSSPIISNNIFHGNISIGGINIEVISCSNSSALISRNLFYGNGGIGCVGLRDGAAGTRIMNNTFDGNARGFFSIAFGGVALNNIVTNSLEYGIGAPSVDHFTILNYNDVWNNNPDYNISALAGFNDISVDPLYFNPANYDFRLQTTSPCINAGHPDSQYYDPDGTRNDMGAFPTTWQIPLAINISFNPASDYYVTGPSPEVLWSYYDTAATTQGQYEVEIGTDTDWTVAEMWDTGPVVSGDTSVVYAGATLDDHTVYYLRIRVNNGSIWGDWMPVIFITHFDVVINVPSDRPTIQAGIDAALQGDTVRIANGTYTGEGNRDLDFWGRNIILESENGPELTTIDCEASIPDPHFAFHIHSGEDTTAVIRGFTITHAYRDDGGAITIRSASPTVNNCVITDNLCSGIRSDYFSHPSVSECTITGNGASGVWLEANGVITNSEISYNDGDGVFLLGPNDMDLSFLLIRGNGGDGIEIEAWGGGNYTISNNTVVQNDRGLYFYYWPPKGVPEPNMQSGLISYNVFAFNTGAGIEGGGLGLLAMTTCNNSFGNPGGDWLSSYGPGDEYDNISLNPLFCDTAAGDFHIAAESPCAPANNLCSVLLGTFGVGCTCCNSDGIRGDADSDCTFGCVTVADLSYLVAHLFQSGPEPVCEDEADADSDCTFGCVNVADLSYLVNFLFQSGPAPGPCPQ